MICFFVFYKKKEQNKKRSCPYVLFSVFSLVFQHSNDLHFHVAACVLKYANSRCVAHVPVFNQQLKKVCTKFFRVT